MKWEKECGFSRVDSNKRGHNDNPWTKRMVCEERAVSFSDRQTGSCRWSRIDSAWTSSLLPLLHPRRRYPQRVRDYGTKDFQHLRGSNVNPHPSTCFGKVQCFSFLLFFYFILFFSFYFFYFFYSLVYLFIKVE